MPPHCDSVDGPVVAAARQALEKEDVNPVLPYVKESASAEVKSAFERTLRARKADPAAREVAERYFLKQPCGCTGLEKGRPIRGLGPRALMSDRSFDGVLQRSSRAFARAF